MITSTVDMTNFNAGIDALRRSVGATSRQIVEKESGELIKTLVRLSPPKDPKKTREKIDAKIRKTFHIFAKASNFEYDDTQTGPSGVKWYAASSKFLFGGAPDTDMRKSEQRDLLAVHYRAKNVQGSRRLILPFRNRKTSQRVALITKIIATPKQVGSLVKKVQSHVGRLKAGWLVAVTKGKIRISGAHLPPKWVTKHSIGARGRFEDGLQSKDYPHFTIANFAKGVTGKASTYFVSSAVKVRAAAMLKNAELHLAGKKNLSDYNKGTSVLKL